MIVRYYYFSFNFSEGNANCTISHNGETEDDFKYLPIIKAMESIQNEGFKKVNITFATEISSEEFFKFPQVSAKA